MKEQEKSKKPVKILHPKGEQPMTLIQSKKDEERESVPEPKKGTWLRDYFPSKAPSPQQPILRPEDIGVKEKGHNFVVNERGDVQPVRGNYYPVGDEFLVSEIPIDDDPRNNDWIFYRKRIHPETGDDEITEHFKVTIRQMRRFLVYDREG
jgi:hypothetical protein